MSLRLYRRPRLVVLQPGTRVLDAARALESNNIGALVVQNEGALVGIVTDRDLALRCIGQGLDPRTTPLSTVMTQDVATLSPMDSKEDAINLMKEQAVRRIPLLDEGKLVGIVTLDDLLLDEGVPLEQMSEVVEAQLGPGGPAGRLQTQAAVRSASRVESTYRRLIHHLQEETGLTSFELTETAVEVVLSGLMRRLSPGGADHLLAQLPSLLQPALADLPPGPDKYVTRETIESDLVQRLDVDPERASELLQIIGSEVLQSVSLGQAASVQKQLPPDLREAFLAPPYP